MENLFALYPPAPPTAEERHLEQQQKAAVAAKLVRLCVMKRGACAALGRPLQLECQCSHIPHTKKVVGWQGAVQAT